MKLSPDVAQMTFISYPSVGFNRIHSDDTDVV